MSWDLDIGATVSIWAFLTPDHPAGKPEYKFGLYNVICSDTLNQR